MVSVSMIAPFGIKISNDDTFYNVYAIRCIENKNGDINTDYLISIDSSVKWVSMAVAIDSEKIKHA